MSIMETLFLVLNIIKPARFHSHLCMCTVNCTKTIDGGIMSTPLTYITRNKVSMMDILRRIFIR